MTEWRRAANRTRKDGPHKAVVEALRAAGCAVCVGGPLDLIVSRADRTWLLEVKSERGKLTPAQEKFLKAWRGRWAIVRTPEEAIAAVAS